MGGSCLTDFPFESAEIVNIIVHEVPPYGKVAQWAVLYRNGALYPSMIITTTEKYEYNDRDHSQQGIRAINL